MNPAQNQPDSTSPSEPRPPTHPQEAVSAEVMIRFRSFGLPPVQDALVIGKRAPMGAQAVYRALDELTPNTFELCPVDHPFIEAIIIHASDVRKLGRERLIKLLLSRIAPYMDSTDSVHVELEIKLVMSAQIDFS